MHWINSGRKGLHFWSAFGQGVVALHEHTGDAFGFEQDNFIGRLPQHNDTERTWPRFFRSQRLAPQVRMARERGAWQSEWDTPLETLYRRLPDLLPKQPPPSIVHGDLWSGNFMVTAVGEAALVDPAAYYGHREVDLAMTELFGGFDEAFYQSYRAAWPLEPGYEERRSIYNLYHLINHLNHFGGRYAGSVASTLQAFA
jgi:fructosamine-3-kinase